MKRIYNLILIAVTLGLCSGCNDYLDLDPTYAVTDKVIWSDTEYAELYVNSFYTYINYYSQYYTTGQCAYGLTEGLTDMMKYGPGTDNGDGVHCGFLNQYVYGMVGTTASSCAYYLSNWSNAYTHIRRINEFLYSMNLYADFSKDDLTRFQAEARFFRGMEYFELVKRHHEVIVYEQNMLDYAKDTPLNTEEESWDIVYEDLTFAGENLPESWSGADNGRVTSYAAYALLSRAMLYAERWQEAYDAAEKVISSGAFSLMDGSTSENYEKCFSTTALEGNTESILDYSYINGTLDHSFDYYFGPGGDGSGYSNARGTPTQEMVEEYEYAGGGDVDWSDWHVDGGTTVAPPYDQLEPRFGATVLYNGASWKGRTIAAYEGGLDGWAEPGTVRPDGKTTTGYFLRKLVDETHEDVITVSSTQPWIMIRYAEVILNRAEAAYRLGYTSTANSDIRTIRERVGLSYTDKSGDSLWQAIRKERKLELAYEGQYFWDLCRWKVLVDEFDGTTVHGFHITAEGSSYRYEYIDCDQQTRTYSTRIYQIPLPESELSYNSKVTQYEEWL